MDTIYFDTAFKYAQKAYNNNEVPVGAIIVCNNKIIGYGYNKKEKTNDVLAHAELNAIKMASKKINNWRLDNCEMYVTLDPCPMCASAIKQSRIKKVYSALSNLDDNNLNIILEIFKADKNNSKVLFETNLFPEKSKLLLNSFFLERRDK